MFVDSSPPDVIAQIPENQRRNAQGTDTKQAKNGTEHGNIVMEAQIKGCVKFHVDSASVPQLTSELCRV